VLVYASNTFLDSHLLIQPYTLFDYFLGRGRKKEGNMSTQKCGITGQGTAMNIREFPS